MTSSLTELDISDITECGNLANKKVFQNGFNFVVFYNGQAGLKAVQAFAEFERRKRQLLPPEIVPRIRVFAFNSSKPNSQNSTITSRNNMCFQIMGYPLVVFFSDRMFCGKYLPGVLPPPEQIPQEFAKFCTKLTANACDRCIWERKKTKGCTN